MGYMVHITESKVEKLSDHIEQGLHHLGRAMSCVEQMLGDEGYGEREGGYGMKGGRYNMGRMSNRYPIYGEGMGYRNENVGYKYDEDWDEQEPMSERRRRSRRTGRFM